MNSFICYQWLTRLSDGLQNFVLRLSARPFSGLVGEADSPPIKFTSVLLCGWYLPIIIFCFIRCVFQHLGLSAKFLRDSICSWGYPVYFYVYKVFGGAPKLSAKMMALSDGICLEGFHLNFIGGYPLFDLRFSVFPYNRRFSFFGGSCGGHVLWYHFPLLKRGWSEVFIGRNQV